MNQFIFILSFTFKVFSQDQETIQGFPVIFEPNVDTESRSIVRSELNHDLKTINGLFHQETIKKLNKVTIWVTKNGLPDGAATYHQSAEWLSANGKDPRIAKCIEIGNIKNFVEWRKLNQPFMLLHEMAHFYHDRVLGNDDPEIQAAFVRVQKSQSYERVPYNLGGKRRAYALTNKFEFFAESTESFFGQNDFYPFNQQALKKFDPKTYLLIKKKWQIKK
jgi:hypothetical protein